MNRLNTLDAWKNGVSNFFSKSSAQSYMGANLVAMASGGSCGSSCGAGDGDKSAPKPSACGAGDDKPAPKPSACGAGDDKPTPKPSACGAGDK